MKIKQQWLGGSLHSTIESCDWFGEYNVINRESRAKREQKSN